MNLLKTSIACKSDKALDMDSFETFLIGELPHYVTLTDMGKRKFIISFELHEKANRSSEENADFFPVWSTNCRKWQKFDVVDTKITWTEITGIPGHGWKRENTADIARI